jgi:hypothetical protein
VTTSSSIRTASQRRALVCLLIALSLNVQAVGQPTDAREKFSRILTAAPQPARIQANRPNPRLENSKQRNSDDFSFILLARGGPAHEGRRGTIVIHNPGLPAFASVHRPSGRSPPDRIS